MFKAVFPSESDIQSVRFDNLMMEILGKIIHYGEPLPDRAKIVANLPIRFGGLGLRSIHDTKTVAWLISFLHSYPRLAARDFFVEEDDIFLSSIFEMARSQLVGCTIPNREDLHSEDLPRLRHILNIFFTSQRENLLRRLYDDGMPSFAAWQFSTGTPDDNKGANEWLFSTFVKEKNYQLSPEHYREGLRSRLLLKSFDDRRRCKCNIHDPRFAHPSSDPFHPVLCRTSQGVMNSRHLALQEPFLNFLREVAPDTMHTRNPLLPNQAEHAPKCSSDVHLSLPSGEMYVDFCVATPAALSYLSPTFLDLSLDRACSKRIAGKVYKYKRAMQVQSEAVLESKFRFFGVDATGRLGIDAKAIIDMLCGGNVANHDSDPHMKEAKKRLYMRVSVVCMRAMLVLSCSGVRVYPAISLLSSLFLIPWRMVTQNWFNLFLSFLYFFLCLYITPYHITVYFISFFPLFVLLVRRIVFDTTLN